MNQESRNNIFIIEIRTIENDSFFFYFENKVMMMNFCISNLGLSEEVLKAFFTKSKAYYTSENGSINCIMRFNDDLNPCLIDESIRQIIKQKGEN